MSCWPIYFYIPPFPSFLFSKKGLYLHGYCRSTRNTFTSSCRQHMSKHICLSNRDKKPVKGWYHPECHKHHKLCSICSFLSKGKLLQIPASKPHIQLRMTFQKVCPPTKHVIQSKLGMQCKHCSQPVICDKKCLYKQQQNSSLTDACCYLLSVTHLSVI